jgi:LCP family protein required for cell wall assembly
MPEKKRVNWKRIVIISVCVLLSLILLAVATVGIYATYLMNKISRNPANESKLTPSEVDQILQSDPDNQPMDPSESLPIINDTPLPSDPIPPVEAPKHIINILLIGQDETSGNHRARSDSMILVTCNTKSKSITFTSFMRDSYVQIPGYPANKLNHAYQYGGMSLLCDTLRVNFGVEIDGAVEINFSSFQEIIDMLGGVEINLTWEEASALNNLESKKEWRLKPGVQVLTGEQALRYARLRHIDSDFQRTERQRKVIMSVIEAYKNCKLSDMMKILEKTMPLITTNISTGQMFTYVIQLFPMISGAQVKTQQLPAAGTFTSGLIKVSENYMASCQYNIDFAANREALNKIFDDIP